MPGQVAVGRVVVIGLGPGDPAELTLAARAAIDGVEHRFVRTRRHPSAALVEPATSFDSAYEHAESVSEVYPAIVEALVEAAGRHGQVLYAVPGSPLVAEQSVAQLRADPRVEVVVLAAVSFLDLAWDRLAVDPLAAGVRLVDGHRFASEAAGHVGPMLVGQCDSPLVLSEIKLSVEEGPEVVILHHLGLAEEAVTAVAWADLDRSVAPDHLTCLWVPGLAEPVAGELTRFDELVRTLRQHCPWDRRQTHQSLTRHLLEEAYEVLEAIDELGADADAGYDHLEEELGDLLFQVFFHATLAAEAGQFTMADVARGVHDKLVARHPHVFGPPGTPQPSWEQLKAEQKGRASLMDGIPAALPALLHAEKVQAKAASVGFDWPGPDGPRAKVDEELAELALAQAEGTNVAEELGDLLFSVVNLARHLEVEAERALRAAVAKFARRFATVESLARQRGLRLDGLGLAGLDELWDEAKQGEPAG